ncbi:hypothetical protein BJ138DRAFT_1166506 [Hygrophoropsis aurantiaca]|uniref:Uncharacterized protein n=1 Tax=Hygrophoropsis aurantiaca TaxID=72124 RepID=A0ACB7ZUN3_9AGAM|nr:hypothetical protein BJ138DRAFT_1166506 [Hygrophoropsis aurantiaca]
MVEPPRHEEPSLTTSSTTCQQASTLIEDPHVSLFWVGLRHGNTRSMFLQLLRCSRPENAGSSLLQLRTLDCPAGRALQGLVAPDSFLVATSLLPETIDDIVRREHWPRGFTELGRLSTILTTNPASAHSTHQLRQVPPCEKRTSIIEDAGLASSSPPLYVVYVYDDGEATITSSPGLLSPPPPVASGHSATIIHPASESLALNDRSQLQPRNIDQYLSAFSSDAQFLQRLHSQAYGVAYVHCLTECTVLRVCEELGIVFTRGRINPARMDSGVEITLDQVITWFGLNHTTFSTMRTNFKLARKAYVLLQGRANLRPSDMQMRRLLEVMLDVTRVLPPHQATNLNQHDVSREEHEAVTMAVAPFMARVRGIVHSYGSVP